MERARRSARGRSRRRDSPTCPSHSATRSRSLSCVASSTHARPTRVPCSPRSSTSSPRSHVSARSSSLSTTCSGLTRRPHVRSSSSVDARHARDRACSRRHASPTTSSLLPSPTGSRLEERLRLAPLSVAALHRLLQETARRSSPPPRRHPPAPRLRRQRVPRARDRAAPATRRPCSTLTPTGPCPTDVRELVRAHVRTLDEDARARARARRRRVAADRRASLGAKTVAAAESAGLIARDHGRLQLRPPALHGGRLRGRDGSRNESARIDCSPRASPIASNERGTSASPPPTATSRSPRSSRQPPTTPGCAAHPRRQRSCSSARSSSHQPATATPPTGDDSQRPPTGSAQAPSPGHASS